MNRFVTALTILALRLSSSNYSHIHAFTPAKILTGSHNQWQGYSSSSPLSKSVRRQWLHAATTDEIGAVSSMRAGEIKKELESYGISTAAFLEKSELVEALVEARAKGLKPKEPQSTASTTTTKTSTSTTSGSSGTSTTATDSRSREVRLKEELEKLKNVKASDMKKELEERGISTASFFEKSEFLKALAEARVDGIDNKKKKKKRRDENDNGEGYAEYSNVEVITDDSAGPRRKESEPSGEGRGGVGANPFAGGASPFGGMGGMPGGMGGMGGIADMLNNLGGMGGFGGGANPFGGMGGMGDMGGMMGKAQELMKNPKVMEIMMKAQKNPKVMAAMQECLSNPSAFAKYRNDPEVSEIIRELEKYM